jgi:ubiquitin-protein ligase
MNKKCIAQTEQTDQMEQMQQTEETYTDRYINKLKPYLIGELNLTCNRVCTTFTNVQIKRIMQEYSQLYSQLPIHFNSSIFFKYDPNNISYSEFVIMGPTDTPYDSGVFHFKMYLPSTYPNNPPKVVPTFNGQYSLNPNIFKTALCLSLLNTTIGAAGERWISGTSSILQVLISIQSLIFNDQPYFNEAANHNKVGKDKLSANYNRETRINVYKYHIDWFRQSINHIDNGKLVKPYDNFNEIIDLHLSLKHEHIRNVYLDLIPA